MWAGSRAIHQGLDKFGQDEAGMIIDDPEISFDDKLLMDELLLEEPL